MGRKLRVMLIFLLFLITIITKEPNMSEARCTWGGGFYKCRRPDLIGSLQNLPKRISRLDLEGNQITGIPSFISIIFSNLPKLTNLKLRWNSLTSIPADTFNLPKLQKLYLNDNKITSIQAGALSNLPKIELIQLSFNQLTNIQPGIFKNLPELHSLYLYSNNISKIQAGAFSDLPQLLILDLRSNKISENQADAFSNLPRPLTLDLARNQITNIKPGTFSNLPKLERLYLHFNKITSIEAGAFTDLNDLKFIQLLSNQLTHIQSGTFSNLPKLDFLNLSKNNITRIQAGTFTNLPELQRLFLNSNKITSIQIGTSSNLPKLQYLNLQSNQISVLPLSDHDMLASIHELHVDNNPWLCDCRMIPILQKQISSVVCSWGCRSRQISSQMTCAQPSNLFGKKLKEVDPKDLICNDQTKSTPPVDTQAQVSSSAVSTSSLSTAESNASPTSNFPGSTVAFATLPGDIQAPIGSSTVSTSSLGNAESNASPTSIPGSSSTLTFATLPVQARHTVSTSPSFGNTESNTSPAQLLARTTNASLSDNAHLQSANNCYNGTVIPHYRWYFKRNVATLLGYTQMNVLLNVPVTASSSTVITGTSHESDSSLIPHIVISAVVGSIVVSFTVATILIVWCKKRGMNPPSGQNSKFVVNNRYQPTVTVISSGHDQTRQGQHQAITEATANATSIVEASDNDHYEDMDNTNTTIKRMTSGQNQTGQGQPQVITESKTNTTVALVTSGYKPQYENIDNQHNQKMESNTDAINSVTTSDHDQTGQVQSHGIIEASNSSCGTGPTTSRPNALHKVAGQWQAITEYSSNTTASVTISGHDQTEQGQSHGIIEARNSSYGTGPTASRPNALYKVVGQYQAITKPNTNTVAALTVGGHDQTGQS